MKIFKCCIVLLILMIVASCMENIPVYLAGKTAPPGKTLGHAGAVISKKSGTIQAKTAAFRKVGVEVAETPKQVISLVKKALK